MTTPIAETIQHRFSCRTYLEKPIEADRQQKLKNFLAACGPGPLGAPVRLGLMAATEQDRKALKGLGTYGFIKNPTGFIVGAMGPGPKNLEDYGYRMEQAILFATDLGLGTCWLGGSFTKSSFARAVNATSTEKVAAVTATGHIADEAQARNGFMRQQVRGDLRLPWATLFFDDRFGAPLSREAAGAYATPLEMVRLGPSATNKQPWRILKAGRAWHFYLQRTPGYRKGVLNSLMKTDDIQRLDMGIAMCHFELTAREQGLAGAWSVADPGLPKPDDLTEYAVSWLEK